MIRKHVLIFDEHGIFVDTKLLSARINFIRDLNLSIVDELIFGGDNDDYYGGSDFLRDRNTPQDIQAEADESYSRFFLYRKAAPRAGFIWVLGNHEDRHRRVLSSNRIPEAYKGIRTLDFKTLFRTNENNIMICDSVYEVTQDFIVTHGTSCGKYPSRAELDRWKINGASGHSHKTDRSGSIGYNSKFFWQSFGHLGDKKMIDKSCNYSKTLMWDQSFGLLITENNKFKDLEVMMCDEKGFYSKYLGKQYA